MHQLNLNSEAYIRLMAVPRSVKQVLMTGTELLSKYSPTASLDAEILLSTALKKARVYLWSYPEASVLEEQIATFSIWLDARQQHIPIAYILGKKEFWGLDLCVSADTLVPRPETEFLVEGVLQRIPQSVAQGEPAFFGIDLGTGTGAIVAALMQATKERAKLVNRRDLKMIAVEYSLAATKIATTNLNYWGDQRCWLIRGDWAESIATASVDFVVSNPPYICENDSCLSGGDVQHEPLVALAAGAEGLDAYKKIIPQVKRILRSGGFLGFEHGSQQGKFVRALLTQQGFILVNTESDLAGHERVTWATKP